MNKIFRIVNLLSFSNDLKLWNTIKEIREKYFFHFLSSTKCYGSDSIFVEESAAESFFQTLKERFDIEEDLRAYCWVCVVVWM